MPNALVIYMVAHQPRRIRLPAQLIQRGTAPEKMDALIFDEAMDRRYFDKVAKYCYRPATELFSSHHFLSMMYQPCHCEIRMGLGALKMTSTV